MLFAACTQEAALVRHSAVTAPASATDALVPLIPSALYQLPVLVGQTISDGAVVVSNAQAEELVIRSVEPIFRDNRRPDNVTVLGTGIAALGRTPGENGEGITRRFPPRQKIESAKGYRIAGVAQGQRYALVVGLSLDSACVEKRLADYKGACPRPA